MSQFSQIKANAIRWFLNFSFGRWLMRTAITFIVPKHRIGVNVVCIDANNHILLLKHVFHPLAPWGLPGGWMDRNESPAECAARELREETGITEVVSGEVIYMSRNPGPDHIIIIYLIEVDSVQPETVIDGVEITDSRWILPNDVPDLLTYETIFAMKKTWEKRNLEFDYPSHQMAPGSF